MSLTHKLLAQYMGTSREVVTYKMNRFRLDGYLSYSRQAIVLDPDASHDRKPYCEDFYREAVVRHQQRATTSSPVQLQWKNCAGFSKITAITS